MRIKLGRPMLLRQIASFSDCTLFFSEEDSCQKAIGYLATDTRELMPGDLFVALRSENNDGHLYLEEAYRLGASAAIIEERYRDHAPPLCLLTAENTFDALVRFAAAWSGSVTHRTIAVTGSVGKTTTRHFLSCILAERYRVHESEGNFNNLLGTTLTLLSMPPETEYLVAECGMDAPGQISLISSLLHPDIAVITGIGISHLEKLKTKEAICKAKLEILDGLMPNGMFYCPSAEPMLCHMTRITPHTFSALDSGSDFYTNHLRQSGFGYRFDLIADGAQVPDLYVPILASSLMPGVVCAAAVALHVGITEEQLRRGLSRYKPLPLRQNIQSLGEILLLLDCYNACPASMKAAGETALHLQEMTGGRIIALLGDMNELGEATESGHREVGAYMAHICESLFCIGSHALLYAEGAAADGCPGTPVFVFPAEADREITAQQIAGRLKPSDILLMKGSRAGKLESFLPIFRKLLL